MRRLLVVALAASVAAGFAPHVCAQRSAAHGSISAHAAPAFHGGFTASAPRSFTGAPRYTGRSPLSSAPHFPAGNYGSRPNYYYGPARYHRPYHSHYGYGYGVPYLGVGWIGPGYLNSGDLDSGYPDSGYPDSGYPGYPDTTTYDDSQAPPNYAGYDNPPPYQAQPAQAQPALAPPPYQAQPAPAPPYPSYAQPQHAPSQPLADEDAVTLIFKDGRPPEQIHNYAMTRTTLYVRDQHHRDIPLDQLDFNATQKANRDAGVDFQLPTISR
jgi:hypothetical protein